MASSLFKSPFGLEYLRQFDKNNMPGYLGIEYLELGDDYLLGRMPVNERTKQPFGLLHGGASVVLAETLGSQCSFLTIEDPQKYQAVGIEINANHLKSVTSGYVYGRCTPLHAGRRTQVWEIKITNDAGNLVCISRITVMIVEAK